MTAVQFQTTIQGLLNEIKFQTERTGWTNHVADLLSALQASAVQKTLACDEYLMASMIDLLLALYPYSFETRMLSKCTSLINLIFDLLPTSLHDNQELKDQLRLKFVSIIDILISCNVPDPQLQKIFTTQEILEHRSKFNPTAKKLEEQVPILVRDIYSSDFETSLNATTGIRKILSIERNPPIRELIQTGIIPRLIKFLGASEYPVLQFEACWALTNIASGTSEQTRVVVEHGALAAIVPLLKSTSTDVREQAVWALGNIAGDGTQCRDMVLSFDVIPLFIDILQTQQTTSIMRNTTWALQNMIKNKPTPPFSLAQTTVPILAHLITCGDHEVVTDACWGLSYLSDYPDFEVSTFVQHGIIPTIIDLLTSSQTGIQTPAVRVIGNIASCEDTIAEKALSSKSIQNLKALLSSPKSQLIKESAWTLSNFAAGPPNHIQLLMDEDIFPTLITIVSKPKEDVAKEGAWAISKAVVGCKTTQLHEFVTGPLKIMDTMVLIVKKFADTPPLIKEILQSFRNILAQENDTYTNLFIKSGAMNEIVYYKINPDDEIRTLAIDILSFNTKIEVLMSTLNYMTI